MIYLYSDVLGDVGGIETYLHALAMKLHEEHIAFRVAVSENSPAKFLDDLIARGIDVYRQRVVPGDRWQVRQRMLLLWLAHRLRAGEWVFCVRQPMPEVYLLLVRAVHARGAKIAVSWMVAPEFLPPPPGRGGERFKRAVQETDAVISVSRCTAHQFRQVYDYEGPIRVVRYHNIEMFDKPLPLPRSPPFKIGFMGRIDIRQKNLDTIVEAFAVLETRHSNVELHIYGGGPDLSQLRAMVDQRNLSSRVIVHGAYDHKRDLEGIVAECHIFIYTSRYEGGPCFSLLELLQGGRYVVTSPIGGIPDIYEGRPDIGLMVSSNDARGIADGLEKAIRKMVTGEINPLSIRARYDEEFDMVAAHRDWLLALDLKNHHHNEIR